MKPKLICSVVEAAFSDAQLRELQAALTTVYQQSVPGQAAPRVIWGETPGANLFTEAKPSASSVLLIEVPNHFPQAERETLMAEICDAWTRTTGASPEQIVVTVADKSYVDLYARALRQRLRPAALPFAALTMARRFGRSQRKRRLLATRTSLSGP